MHEKNLSDNATSPPSILATDAGVAEKFQRLAKQWKEDIRFSSNVNSNLSHPAYLRIMAMGENALPLILKDLRDHGGHWFLALRYIVDENESPVPLEHAANVKLMTEDWLEWGRQHHYL